MANLLIRRRPAVGKGEREMEGEMARQMLDWQGMSKWVAKWIETLAFCLAKEATVTAGCRAGFLLAGWMRWVQVTAIRASH